MTQKKQNKTKLDGRLTSELSSAPWEGVLEEDARFWGHTRTQREVPQDSTERELELWEGGERPSFLEFSRLRVQSLRTAVRRRTKMTTCPSVELPQRLYGETMKKCTLDVVQFKYFHCIFSSAIGFSSLTGQKMGIFQKSNSNRFILCVRTH